MARRLRYRACRVCGARHPFVSVSASGLCPDHARFRQVENTTQLRAHSGPYFRHWRARMAASVGGALLDEQAEQG